MMRPSLLPCALSVLAISVFAGRVARAQPVSTPDRDATAQLSEPNTGSTDKADAIFRQGNDLYRLKKYVEAEAAYEEALRLKKVHDIAANLGYAEMRQGKLREAAEHLDFAVRTWPPTGKQDKRQYAVERLAIVKKEVATLTIQVAVSEAEVFVDGVSVGKTPLTGAVFVEPGSRTIEAKHSGYVDARQVLEATKGAEQTVTLALVAAPVATPMPSGPGIGAGAGSTTGSTTAPPVTPPLPPSTRPMWPVALGAGAAAVFLGGGLAFTVVSNGHRTDSRDSQQTIDAAGRYCGDGADPTTCSTLADSISQTETFRSLAVAGFVGAGLLVVATSSYALWPTAEPKASSGLRVVPVVAPSAAGLTMGGVF
jgi:PEGA domain/Tetratricopeptide repeat